jgi:hypothetical protein
MVGAAPGEEAMPAALPCLSSFSLSLLNIATYSKRNTQNPKPGYISECPPSLHTCTLLLLDRVRVSRNKVRDFSLFCFLVSPTPAGLVLDHWGFFFWGAFEVCDAAFCLEEQSSFFILPTKKRRFLPGFHGEISCCCKFLSRIADLWDSPSV